MTVSLVALLAEYFLSQGTVLGTNRPFMLAYSLALVLLAMVTQWSKVDLLNDLSRHSYLIYLSHVFWIQLIDSIPMINQLTIFLQLLLKLILLILGLWLTVLLDQGLSKQHSKIENE